MKVYDFLNLFTENNMFLDDLHSNVSIENHINSKMLNAKIKKNPSNRDYKNMFVIELYKKLEFIKVYCNKMRGYEIYHIVCDLWKLLFDNMEKLKALDKLYYIFSNEYIEEEGDLFEKWAKRFNTLINRYDEDVDYHSIYDLICTFV